jgi:hypothetical protein
VAKAKPAIIESVNKTKEIKLYFSEDAYYKGELLYKKGVHSIDTTLGWAARWISRGATLVVGDSHQEAAVSDKGEIVPQGKPTPIPVKEEAPKQLEIPAEEEVISNSDEKTTLEEIPLDNSDDIL